jgi:hypothetical protein
LGSAHFEISPILAENLTVGDYVRQAKSVPAMTGPSSAVPDLLTFNDQHGAPAAG